MQVQSLPLVERDEQVAAVSMGWQRLAPGFGEAWLVCAEGGGGKTAFLRACAGSMPAGRQAWGEADPISPPEPYLAISRAIAGFSAESAHGAAAARAVQAVAERAGDGPFAVILDDLHYADEGTIGVAHRLAIEARARGWLVLLAFRPREGHAALHEMAAELVAHGRASRLDLPPLSVEGVTSLVRRLRGDEAAATEAAHIFAESGGNPWFVEALARGEAALSAAHHRIQVRLTRIEREFPGAFPVLSALSAVTSAAPYNVVAEICGGDSRELRALLRALLEAGILEEHEDSWRFRQEMMRRSVLEAMIPADRRDAHRRLAEAMEGAGRPTELAMHYAAAGDPRAGQWALKAAREAIAMEAHPEAYAQLQRALAGDLPQALRLEACELAADEASALGRADEPIAYAERGLALSAGNPVAAVRLAAAAAMTLHWRGAVEKAVPFWERGEAEARAAGETPEVGLLHACRALCLVVSEDGPGARAAAAAARATNSGDGTTRTSRLALAFGDLADALARMIEGDAKATSAAAAALERVREVGLVMWTMGLAAFSATALTALEGEAAEAAIGELSAVLERRQVGIRLSNSAFNAFLAVQRGDLSPVTVPDPRQIPVPPRSGVAGRLLAVHALREVRGGSLAAAATMVGREYEPDERPLACASLDIARLEYLALAEPGALAGAAEAVRARRGPGHCARVLGEAAVHLARAGIATPRPNWLPKDSVLRLFWEWAQGIRDEDEGAIRAVAEQLDERKCPYEAAVALADAGDLSEAYRRLRAMEATNLRDRLAARMRESGIPVPRRTKSAIARDGLTDTEREVAKLVAGGTRNREVADVLGVSVRTVETHLANLYRKLGVSDRGGLTRWWMTQPVG